MAKRSLVLSGGGSRGAWQLGALKALIEKGTKWDTIHGISVGALNGSFLAMTPKENLQERFPDLENIWLSILSSENIYKPWFPVKIINYLMSMFTGSLNSGDPLRKIVESNFNKEKLQNSPVEFTAGCCSLTTGQYVSISSKSPKILEYILASSHLPLVFEPLTIDNEQWVDGGIRHQIPILEALRENPDEIDVVLTSPVAEERVEDLEKVLKSCPRVALRASEILADQVYINDYFTVSRVIKQNKIKIRVFVPKYSLEINSMNFEGNRIKEMIKAGYEETLEDLK